MSLSLPTQSIATDPLEIILSFTFHTLPPTNVTCQFELQPIHIDSISREVVSALQSSAKSETPEVNVTISSMRPRQAGVFQCNVSVFITGHANYMESLPPLTTQGQYSFTHICYIFAFVHTDISGCVVLI